MGVDIEEKDYCLSSLPVASANFASVQLTAARMYSITKTLDPDILISLIGEEYDHQNMQHLCKHGGKSKENDDKDEVMAVNSGSSKGKGGKIGAKKVRGECWNCGEEGHFKNKCPKPPKNDKAKKKEPSSSKEKTAGSANAATEQNSDSESEGAWMVYADDEMASLKNRSIPGQKSVTDSSSDCSNIEETSSDDNDWLGRMQMSLTT